MQRLIEEIILPSFGRTRLGPVGLEEMDDGASLDSEGRFIVCTDAHTVQPLFFPGGDIGHLTACGTINDLTAMGAQPIAMTNTVIVEEGFEIEDLQRILHSLNSIIEPLGVAMIAGDTKVMPRGTIDGLVMSTTGIGRVYLDHPITDSGAQPGDDIIVTGPIGDHGTALLAHREGLEFETSLTSDVAPLWEPVRSALDVGGVHAMKDPTRGGTAVALNEIATKSEVVFELMESQIPIRPAVRSLCEILGLNPLHMSSEGRIVMTVDSSKTEDILSALQNYPSTHDAAVIGTVKPGKPRVLLHTTVGGRKVVQVPLGEPVPRVC